MAGALAKGGLAAVLFGAATGGAFAAWKVRRHGGRCLALAEAFTGGALLNAALVHLLAEVAEELGDDEAHRRDDETYAWPELLCGIGALLTHLLEGVAEALAGAVGPGHSHKQLDASELQTAVPRSVIGQGAESAGGAVSSGRGDTSDQVGADLDAARTASDTEDSGLMPAAAAAGRTPSAPASGGQAWRSLATGPLLMLALSVHSLLEGLSLGAASESRALHIFVAILAHKGIAAFSLGIAWLSASGSGRRYAAAMAWFASVTPLGVLLGVSAEGSAWGDVLTALSSGTFLYIGLVEACPGVKTPWLPGLGAVQQAAAFGAGYACMATLALWA